jgi:hypothetical protein
MSIQYSNISLVVCKGLNIKLNKPRNHPCRPIIPQVVSLKVFLLPSFYDIQNVANFSKTLTRLAKFTLRNQKNSQKKIFFFNAEEKTIDLPLCNLII